MLKKSCLKMNPASCLSYSLEKDKKLNVKRDFGRRSKRPRDVGTAFGGAGDKGWGAEKLCRR